MTPTASLREAPADCAKRLQISLEAASLYHDCEVVDLHVDSFIWTRLAGYDLSVRHTPGLTPGHFFRQVDLPRLLQVGLDCATWVITTNPWRSAAGRRSAFERNLGRLTHILESSGQARVVGSFSDYRSAREAGMHAAFIGIQGGNAVGPPYAITAELAQRLLRVTLVHLTTSSLGATSAPLRWRVPRSRHTDELVAQLNERRVFVDLAHISRSDFDHVLAVHSRDVPPIVTHTGVCGAREHWRNLTDGQLRAVADRGGIVGIMYHSLYVRKPPLRAKAADVVRHIRHAIDVCGEDAVALGSDWDGLITTPSDMPTCLEHPRLVEEMLRAGLRPNTVRKVLGHNFLRLLHEVRP